MRLGIATPTLIRNFLNDKDPSLVSIIVQLRVLQSKPCLPQIPVKDGKMIRNGTAQQKAIIRREFRRAKILLFASGKLNVIHLKKNSSYFLKYLPSIDHRSIIFIANYLLLIDNQLK